MSANFPMKITPLGGSNPEIIRGLESQEIAWPTAFVYWARYRILFGAGDWTQDAATSQALDLNATYPRQQIPLDVRRVPGTFGRLVTPVSGGSITAFTIQIGDAGDPNGILTAVSVFGGVPRLLESTPAAAENEARQESAYVPLATLTSTTDDIVAADAGEIVVFIPYRKLPQ